MADNTKKMKITVLRYRPEQDDKPWDQTFEVPYHEATSLLEALFYIKDNLEPSLSFRWSCRMAICGSCGMMVNGVPHLACKTFLRDYEGQDMRIDPLDNFPIERDLVVDLSDLIEKIELIKPYIIPSAKDAKMPLNKNFKQSPMQMEAYLQFAQCINCGCCCYAACPQYKLNPEFIGPAALTLLYRYNTDNRDSGTKERMPFLSSENGVWGCTFVGYCSEVCPKQVDPSSAIQLGKKMSATDYVIKLVKPEE